MYSTTKWIQSPTDNASYLWFIYAGGSYAWGCEIWFIQFRMIRPRWEVQDVLHWSSSTNLGKCLIGRLRMLRFSDQLNDGPSVAQPLVSSSKSELHRDSLTLSGSTGGAGSGVWHRERDSMRMWFAGRSGTQWGDEKWERDGDVKKGWVG